MKVNEYTEVCKNFAAETKSWGALDHYKFYTTTGAGWEESCDNASGGIDVSWAFHQTAEKIEREAAQRFVDLLRDFVETGRDDKWSGEQWDYLLELLD